MLQSGIFFLILVGTSFGSNVVNHSTVHQGNLLAGPQPYKLIIGGHLATKGQFPYMASIQYNGAHYCGGSIILPRWVLTSGLCTLVAALFPVNYSVVVGTVTLYSSTGRNYTVERFITYPYFNVGRWMSNDIGLVRTTTDIAFTHNVKPISICPYPMTGDEQLVLSGWEKTPSTYDALPNLKYTFLTNMNPFQCWRKWYLYFGINQLCTAASTMTSACQGASAGVPLTYNGQQVALVSFTSTNCDVTVPTVYTSVLPYAGWIKQTVY